jgi:hypothetical protein
LSFKFFLFLLIHTKSKKYCSSSVKKTWVIKQLSYATSPMFLMCNLLPILSHLMK